MYIYKTTNLINGKIYVGQTIYDNCEYFGSGLLIQKALKKYGVENFKKEILCDCATQEELNKMEKYWIKKLNSTDSSIGYNILEGGRFYDDTREKISKSLIGKSFKKPSRKGIHLTLEHREKISRSTRGKKRLPLSDDHKEKISKALSGRPSKNKGKHFEPMSEEQKEKRRVKLKGKKRPAFSEEWKKNISRAKSGCVPWNKGKSWTNPRKWINNKKEEKFVLLSDVELFLNVGWKLGRLFKSKGG